MRPFRALLLALVVSGCVAGGSVPEGSMEREAAVPVTAAPGTAPPRRPGFVPAPAAEAGPEAEPAAPDAPIAEAEPVATEEAETPVEPAVEAAPEPEATAEAPADAPAEVIAPAVVSPEQKACERRGGRFGSVGGSEFHVCFMTPRDAGKACTKSGDCLGECLARSRTCAPVIPLFGCNDVLNDRGDRQTLCIN